MRYIIDIDGTICSQEKDYHKSVPYSNRINKINKLYETGHTIILFTARGMVRHSENTEEIYKNLYDFTKKQLDSWEVKYHKLIMGKPSGDYYIDDKGINANEFFNDNT